MWFQDERVKNFKRCLRTFVMQDFIKFKYNFKPGLENNKQLEKQKFSATGMKGFVRSSCQVLFIPFVSAELSRLCVARNEYVYLTCKTIHFRVILIFRTP